MLYSALKRNRVLGDFGKNVGQFINVAVGLLKNLPYHIFKTVSFVTVVHLAYRCNQ